MLDTWSVGSEPALLGAFRVAPRATTPAAKKSHAISRSVQAVVRASGIAMAQRKRWRPRVKRAILQAERAMEKKRTALP